MPRKKKQKRSREGRRPEPAFPARYGVGNRVRVKPGTTVPDFADVPLGGWAGTIAEVDQRSSPPTYRIEWNKHTLDHMHPVFRKRCERDGLGLESMWLSEDDVEPDGSGLVVIEQPTNIVTRPLSRDIQDDRIRAIFDLTSDDALPLIHEESLRRYHRFLATHLSFPFQASCTVETGPFAAQPCPVTVIRLFDPDECDADAGLLAEAVEQGEPVELPLTEIEATSNLPNRQLIEDYAYWFTNGPTEFEESSEPRQWSLPASPLFSAAPPARRGVATTLLVYGVVGALCGSVLGSLLAATESARIGAGVGAVIVAFIAGAAGAHFGMIFGAVNRIRYGPLLVGGLGAIAGGAVGALLGAMVVALVATVVGGIVGGWVGSQLAKLRWRPIGTFKGALIGAGAGGVVQAVSWDQEKALTGVMVGAGAGAILGPLLWLAVIGSLALTARNWDE